MKHERNKSQSGRKNRTRHRDGETAGNPLWKTSASLGRSGLRPKPRLPSQPGRRPLPHAPQDPAGCSFSHPSCAGLVRAPGPAPVPERSLDDTHPLSSNFPTGLLWRGKGLLCRDVTRRPGSQPADSVIGGGGGGRRPGGDGPQCREGLGVGVGQPGS